MRRSAPWERIRQCEQQPTTLATDLGAGSAQRAGKKTRSAADAEASSPGARYADEVTT